MQRRKKSPSADMKVAYHTSAPSTAEPGMTKFTLEHTFYFKPHPTKVKDEGGETSINSDHAAACIPIKSWIDSPNCCLAWSMKWSVIGLTPVRPHIVLSTTLELACGSATSLTGPTM